MFVLLFCMLHCNQPNPVRSLRICFITVPSNLSCWPQLSLPKGLQLISWYRVCDKFHHTQFYHQCQQEKSSFPCSYLMYHRVIVNHCLDMNCRQQIPPGRPPKQHECKGREKLAGQMWLRCQDFTALTAWTWAQTDCSNTGNMQQKHECWWPSSPRMCVTWEAIIMLVVMIPISSLTVNGNGIYPFPSCSPAPRAPVCVLYMRNSWQHTHCMSESPLCANSTLLWSVTLSTR